MLSPSTIVRAWKNEDYRHTLSDTELALLPDNPVGSTQGLELELADTLDILPSCYPSAKPCSYSCDYKL